jgi:predicted RNA-binding protein with PIN domain
LSALIVERNQIEQAKDKLKDAMIKYAPLDNEE